jgi:HK97 family phage portal protein
MAWFNPFSWSGNGNTRHEGYQSASPSRYSSDVASTVTFDSAMTVSAFWASARLLTEAVSAMPIKCYKRMPDGSRQEDRDYPLWRVLNFQPNRYQTRTEYFESLMLNLVTCGNSYSELIKTSRGIVSFIPLMAAQMKVKLLTDGSIQYEYTDLNSSTRIIPSDKIWHVKLFGNTIVGMSPLGYARQSLGIAQATDARVGKLAKNGGKTSGILSIDRVLSPPQREQVRANMQDIAEGETDSLKILEADMKFQQVGLSPQDLQMLESRRFQIEDIARFMGVPSVLINDTAGSTVWGSGVNQLIGGFYKLNLNPYLERIESSIKRHLMPVEDWESYDIEFDFDSLLRSDRDTRLTANAKAINSGQLSPNEARNDEGRPDKEGGDSIYLNGSLVPAGQKPEQAAPPTTPAQEEDENEDD